MEEMDVKTFVETFGWSTDVCPICKTLISSNGMRMEYSGFKCPACGEEMPESEVSYEKQNYFDELRTKTHTFELTNQTVIELAYLTKDIIEPCIEGNYKLLFDQANCYLACYFICKSLLELVDKEYLTCHKSLYDFYYRNDNKKLSNDWDRLHWKENGEKEIKELELERMILIEEHKRKIGDVMCGKKRSPEARRAISKRKVQN